LRSAMAAVLREGAKQQQGALPARRRQVAAK
jgi:hypothetical protein